MSAACVALTGTHDCMHKQGDKRACSSTFHLWVQANDAALLNFRFMVFFLQNLTRWDTLLWLHRIQASDEPPLSSPLLTLRRRKWQGPQSPA